MDLRTAIRARLDAEDVGSEVADLVLAAFSGPDALTRVIAGEPPTPPQERGLAQDESSGTFLTSITVEGFRGIGDAATLDITPGPGLSLVIGRNGSGKSSFSEGLEVLLTGDSWRWRDRSRVWREGWRNLHSPQSSRVAADFVVEGRAGPLRAERAWDATDREVGDADTVIAASSGPRLDLDKLGWTRSLELYRPILSHVELSSMLADSPSALFDAMLGILGLEVLVDASRALRETRLEKEKSGKEAKSQLDDVRGALEGVEDDRARACFSAISGRVWDLDSFESAVTGTAGSAEDSDISILNSLVSLQIPDLETIEAAVVSLRAAGTECARLVEGPGATASELADLLEAATRHHEHHGDEVCPVCGVGDLDASWRASADRKLIELRRQAREYDGALDRLQRAQALGTKLRVPVPSILDEVVEVGVDVAPVREAWVAFENGQHEGSTELADHLETAHRPLADALTKVKAAAQHELDERQAAWRVIASRIAPWLKLAQEADAAIPLVDDLKAAELWLKDGAAALRAERFAPISAQAQRFWEQLRHQSNVDIERIVLEGSGTQRRVTLDATVDGTPAPALAVMSQGELNCLALSLFLPRATAPESPFRFVVIDDPVQAMDPARVDGLAHVLSEIAATRQVVVLTHDDRLPEAVRRLSLPTTILEITRREGSVVELRRSLNPIDQYFADARALIQDPDLPDTVGRRVVPGLCRSGLEAACVEVVRRRRIGRGDPHSDVEQTLADAHRLTVKASLAFFDEERRGGDVLPFINRSWGRQFGDVFQDANRGAHRAHHGDLRSFVDEASALAERIRRL